MTWSKTSARIAPMLSPIALAVATPACAQTVEEVQARLIAQEQINRLLMQRIETLEAALEGRKLPARETRADDRDPSPGDDGGMDALDRAFVRRGIAVLPDGIVEVTPSLLWGHAEGDFTSPTDDIFGFGLDARIGVAGGWMLGASIPVLHRRIADGGGSASGLGDVSATVWKSLATQTDRQPSLLASVRYVAPTGRDASSSSVPLGSGLHQLTAGLSSAKTFAPIAFTGSLRYTTFLGDTFRSIDVDRGNIYGAAVGANLAVTPDISVSTGLDFAFESALRVNGVKIDGSRETRGLLEIGVGTVLARNIFLTFNSAIGITPDSPDVTLSVSLPFRF